VALEALPLSVLQSFNPQISEDVFAVLSLEGSVNSRNHLGGTAPAQVRAQAEKLRGLLVG
jgi:argininosuccinate lyase